MSLRRFQIATLYHLVFRRALPATGLAAAMLLASSPAQAGDAKAGGMLFKQRCSACHSVVSGAPAGAAPNLSGVVGRKAGSTKFNYSPALKSSGLTWSSKTLDTFLTSPMKMVKGTRMVISLPNAKQRADVIAYLEGTR